MAKKPETIARDATLDALKKLLDLPIPKRAITVDIDVHSDTPADSCIERMREAYAVMRAVFDEEYQALQVLRQKYMDCPQPELIDVLFALIQIGKFAHDLSTECNKTVDLINKTVCERWAVDPNSKPSVHGKYARGEPKYKDRAKLPKRAEDPENYHGLYDWLGVPRDLQDHGPMLLDEGEFPTKVVEISYPGFQFLLERLQAMGTSIPPFIKPYEIYTEATVKVCKVEDLL